MDKSAAAPLNRLADQSSPYLRAHARNPVEWYPWGSEALELARREHKPILLSIGYAACHWCHVMAHESFEDEATAALMNELFVNIKVDREERPDLDRLYQLSQQLLTGRGGGWPLTMFLLPEDQRPFFGGTYFPPSRRHGLPTFADLLRQVARLLSRPRSAAAAGLGSSSLPRCGSQSGPPATAASSTKSRCALLGARLEQSFDPTGAALARHRDFRIPAVCPPAARLACQRACAEPDLQALYMVSLTLTRMAEGGLFDQLGGGFFRYSVDARWEIPHFEKMLYDNAQLLAVYAETAAATGETLFAGTAARTVEWMQRELWSGTPGAGSDGAFYSSLDADTEGEEGRFYLWDRESARQALGAIEWQAFEARYGLDQPPNFESRWWHLQVRGPLETLAQRLHLSEEQLRRELAQRTAQLLQLRSQRARPALDDKLLCSWNALAIAGLATAARCLGRDDYTVTASAALQYLRRVHWRQGRLLASSAAGVAQLPAYLDDYAFLIDAILELAGLRFRVDELDWAIALAEVLLQHFEDASAGGFFFTADDHEVLISRPKSFGDEALPAGNAVAARALLRLGYLLAEAPLPRGRRALLTRRVAGAAQVSRGTRFHAGGTRGLSASAADHRAARPRSRDGALADAAASRIRTAPLVPCDTVRHRRSAARARHQAGARYPRRLSMPWDAVLGAHRLPGSPAA